METSVDQTSYPLHRTKTVHLVRHAQGIHNVEGEKDQRAYLSEQLFDAHLTSLGWQQVDNLRKHVHECGLNKKIELVIASPLLRYAPNLKAWEHVAENGNGSNSVGVFGGEGYVDGIKSPPLMVANAGKGVYPSDRRRSISEYQHIFPSVDFSLIENNHDILWKADIREKNEEVAARGLKFLNWLWTRKEKEIAVVSHSGFLDHTLSAFGNDCHPLVKSEICTHFANCELRSVVIVDKGMLGSDPATTNYPGKVPCGLDLPSDVATEMHPGK